MSVISAGPPLIRLTVAMRSCLLRAARERLAQLHEDYDGVGRLGHPASTRELLFIEIACITAAIAWLWVQPAVDDGG